jgi:SAM-dependent MidA family methyltransferase
MRDNHTSVPITEPRGLAALIREEIERAGPIPFERFMDLALYAPGLGYYVRGRDPFGVKGDFYTAEQLQPVFGVLIAQFAASLRAKIEPQAAFRVVELGAGRGEMASALAEFSYASVDMLRGAMPERVDGLMFANEFFDALPVRVAVRRGGRFREALVTFSEGRFRFMEGPDCEGQSLEYLERFSSDAGEGSVIEIHLRAIEWLDRIWAALNGWLLIIDYGYTSREFERYNQGTLMSYHRHTASEDVLSDPGNRDITAHVPFSVLEEELRRRGFEVERLQTLASFLLKAGEADRFEAALRADGEKEALMRRMQLKTLLYGMGETFRVLVAKSSGQK